MEERGHGEVEVWRDGEKKDWWMGVEWTGVWMDGSMKAGVMSIFCKQEVMPTCLFNQIHDI